MLKPLRKARKGLSTSTMSRPARTNPRSRSTLQDVAQMAGVSATTVSLVLAGKAGTRRISEDTHVRVHDAARTLGYTPSLLHRSMRHGRTHVLSLFNAFRNREPGDLYMDRLSAAVEHAGGSLGYDVLVHCNFRRTTEETYEFLNGGLSDGLILFGSTPDEPLLPLLRESNLPAVLIGPREGETSLSTVDDNEAMGMRLIAEALVGGGHTHLAALVETVAGTLDPTGRLRRLQGELASRGLRLDDRRAVTWNRDADESLARILQLSPRPTAVFVWHDRTAYRLLEACDRAGVRVPDDLSIVGYDGIVWPSTSGHVVATVQVPLDAMALAAVALLDRLVEGENAPLTQTLSVDFSPGTTIGPVALHASNPMKDIL